MTQEKRIVFDVQDLIEFEVSCDMCGKGASYPIDSSFIPHRKCLHCLEMMDGSSWTGAKAIIHEIRQFRGNYKGGIGFRLKIKDSAQGEG